MLIIEPSISSKQINLCILNPANHFIYQLLFFAHFNRSTFLYFIHPIDNDKIAHLVITAYLFANNSHTGRVENNPTPYKEIMEKKNLNPNTNRTNAIDRIQIHSLYRLQHTELDAAFNQLKAQMDEQFQAFKGSLLVALNNLNYIRYLQSHPEQDIQFVFQPRSQQSQQRMQTLLAMADFDVIKQDHAGISDNCLYQLMQFIKNKPEQLFNWQSACPSGVTFLRRHEQLLNRYESLWKEMSKKNDHNLENIFNSISPLFPKEQLKKLTPLITSQTIQITINSAELLFRASEHSFQSSAFKERCQDLGPTLLIAVSEHGKIFGAYTPCKWINTKEKEFVADPSSTSFLFSLDTGMTFPLKRSQLDYAISAYGGWGPIYGSPYGPDLSISDKCHQNDHSCSSLGSHYEIPVQIKQHSTEAFSLLAGSKKFKVLEYEVYQLIPAQ